MDNCVIEALTEDGELAYRIEISPEFVARDEAMRFGTAILRHFQKENLCYWVDGEPVLFIDEPRD